MNHRQIHRRGLVILLVLSFLVLFLMLGATLLVIASRARTASRAFLAASDKSASAPALSRQMLDEALLILIRGSRDTGTEAVLRESLLGDMYGYTSNSTTESNRAPFRDGRVATPSLSALPDPYGEPYDAFDDRNPFLSFHGGNFSFSASANVTVASLGHVTIGGNATLQRAAFQPPGNSTLQVDNDGDGAADGVWFSTTNGTNKLLPDVVAPNGNRLSFRVSYLVLDLDGRINVNAHGGSDPSASKGPGLIDLSGTQIMGNSTDTLSYLRTGTPSPYGPDGRNHRLLPRNFRQSPILAQAGSGVSIPGRVGEPYVLRLDLNAPRLDAITGNIPPLPPPPATFPFTLGELERVLRPFDSDWATLSPRLASMVTDLDGAARRTFTTDSWDVPFVTGQVRTAAGESPRPKFDLSGSQWGALAGGGALRKDNAADKEIYANELLEHIRFALPSPLPAGTEQWCANVAEYWGGNATAPLPMNVGSQGNLTGVIPSVFANDDRPEDEVGKWSSSFESPADLLGVPKGTQAEIQTKLSAMPPEPVISLASEAGNRGILDVVGMASPFTETTKYETKLNLVVKRFAGTPGNSTFQIPVREPGRVNVNTCSDELWNALWGGTGPARDGVMESTWDIVKRAANNGADVRDLDRPVANRLAMAATVRSNVFAIWITLEVQDNGLDAGPPRYYRLFAIVDRSIPVNYARGFNTVTGLDGSFNLGIDPPAANPIPVTTDVRNVIRVKRFLN